MGSPLGPTLANAFLYFYERKWLEKCLLNINQLFTEDMLITFLFYSNQPIISKNFVPTLITCHPNMSFSFEKERNSKMSFLDVEKAINL